MLIYQITLPQDQDADGFIAFMRDMYIPAVHKGPTRVGQVTGLALLQSRTATHEFFLHQGWGGLQNAVPRDGDWRELPNIDSADREQLERTFEAFNIRVRSLGSYAEVAAWSPD